MTNKMLILYGAVPLSCLQSVVFLQRQHAHLLELSKILHISAYEKFRAQEQKTSETKRTCIPNKANVA